MCFGLEADAAVCAFKDGKLIAFARYFDSDTIHGAGTWVAQKYRGRGLAKRMWALILRRSGKRMKFTAVTPEGAALGYSLANRFDVKIDDFSEEP